MFFAGIIFLSGVSISLVAAYFSIIGLATMFPGSKEAIIIMGGVLEIGKLIAAVWLHKNWDAAFGFLKYYLLSAVIILSVITSMGIFGFLSKSHVEHGASIEKEEAIISQIDQKITRKQNFIDQRKSLLEDLDKRLDVNKDDDQSIISRLSTRIEAIKQEELQLVEVQNSEITQIINEENILNSKLEQSKKPKGLFSTNDYEKTLASQKDARENLKTRKDFAIQQINTIRSDFAEQISDVRAKIDSIQFKTKPISSLDPKIDGYQKDIEEAYEDINELENQKFEYGSALRALEVEIGPIKYIVGALDEWIGFKVGTEQAIRIIIVILIFVFDPLAILLLISATISYGNSKEEDLPPDVKEIRNKLLEELEEYLNDGGLADHFIERVKK